MSKDNLISVLKNPGKYPWNYALYLPKESWTPNTSAMVLDPDDIDNPEDPDDDPRAAKDAGFEYVLMMQDVDSISQNARLQKSSISEKDLFKAFTHYIKNDAFITL